jgi:hypothetical protein
VGWELSLGSRRGNKKAPVLPGLFFCLKDNLYLSSVNIGSLQPLGTVGHFECNFIAFSEGFESFTVDGGEMDENVITILL